MQSSVLELVFVAKQAGLHLTLSQAGLLALAPYTVQDIFYIDFIDILDFLHR